MKVKHLSSARSTKNSYKQGGPLQSQPKGDYSNRQSSIFESKRKSVKSTLLKKSGKTLKEIYAINQNVKQCIDKKKGWSRKKSTSRSFTSNSLNSGRYNRKTISNQKLKKINDKVQAVLYPNTSVSKDKNNDIVVGLDFRHSFSHDFNYKESPDKNNSIHKRIISAGNKLNMVDSNLLRERGREIKIKKKKFHISSKPNREGARSEVSIYTPDTKTPATTYIDMKTQTEMCLLPQPKIQSIVIDSSEPTMRKSCRSQNPEMVNFIKLLKDLIRSGNIHTSVLTAFNESYDPSIYEKLSKENVILKQKYMNADKELGAVKQQKAKQEKSLKEIEANFKSQREKWQQEKEDFNQKISSLQEETEKMARRNQEMLEEIEFMKQREIERIQQLDLDDIDLISHSSQMQKHKYNEHVNHKNISKPNPLVPKLDFTKIFEQREKPNQKAALKETLYDEDITLSHKSDYVTPALQEGDYQSPSCVGSQYKEYFWEGSPRNTDDSEEVLRREELKLRKEEIINQSYYSSETDQERRLDDESATEEFGSFGGIIDDKDTSSEFIKDWMIRENISQVNHNSSTVD
ncbi:unnamed protein product [Moneuplotes crassus]|uniref:Uncharacterized protein n=1 Tax=Euplotes crassus TaxID=5936 RepID=A0AAD1U489_EUPCR|nr:unnamed protein product [Moneuplotes crassus]